MLREVEGSPARVMDEDLAPAIKAWALGVPVVHVFGHDAGSKDMRRGKDIADTPRERLVGSHARRCVDGSVTGFPTKPLFDSIEP
jgi:hypothetical protein